VHSWLLVHSSQKLWTRNWNCCKFISRF
jgi:hypothetical protein